MVCLALIFFQKYVNLELPQNFSCTELNNFSLNSICRERLDYNKDGAYFSFVFSYYRDRSILNYIYNIYYLPLFDS